MQETYLCRCFEMAIWTSVRWYLIELLICLCVRMSDAEHVFMCLITICMSSSKKYPFLCFACLCLGWLCFWYWAVWGSLFWRWIPYGYLHLQIFLPISGCSCLSFWVSFVVQVLLWLIGYCFLIFGLFFIHLRGVSEKTLLWFMLLSYLSLSTLS